MPIYEYKCPSCSVVISRLARMDDDGAQLKCESCGHAGLEKVFSVFASPKRDAGKNASKAQMPCGGCADMSSCPRKLD